MALDVLFDTLFDERNQHSPLGAVGCLLMATDADEVWVHRAVAILRHGHDQAAKTRSAYNAGLEVVRMLALLLASRV